MSAIWCMHVVSPDIPISSTNTNDRHGTAAILLKMDLNAKL
jgi:hypothetical protein